MPVSGEMKNKLLEKLKEEAKYATVAAQTLVSPSSEASANGRVIKLTAAPATGTIIVITNLNGKTVAGENEGGLEVGRQYYVYKKSSTEIEIGFTLTQAESSTAAEHIEFTVAIKTSTVFAELAEAGSSTARVNIEHFGTPANGKATNSTAAEVTLKANCNVKWITYWTALTAGTLVGVSEVPEKKLETTDVYKITETLLEDLAAA
jgi:hypothetical protein